MKLRFQKRALHQIDRALGYISERLPQGAAKVEARLAAILVVLQQQPLIGAKTRVAGVRRLVISPYPYLIDYYLGEDEIVVQRFRHTARRPLTN